VKFPQVPRRKLGKTGVEVPCLALGFGGAGEPIVLTKALEWGVNQWDTSACGLGREHEKSIGEYISRNPQVRKELFMQQGSKSQTAEDMEKWLADFVKCDATDYIDLYCGVYMMSDPAQLSDEVKKWAESAKKRKTDPGFSYKYSQEYGACLQAAAKPAGRCGTDRLQFPIDCRMAKCRGLLTPAIKQGSDISL